MMLENRTPREGELFLVVSVEGYTFELRYGYYEESDRVMGEPVSIYPDLKNNPIYTKDGRPLVTAVQVPCENYEVPEGYEREDCCSNCIYYPNMRDEISICQCERRRVIQEPVQIKSLRGGS